MKVCQAKQREGTYSKHSRTLASETLYMQAFPSFEDFYKRKFLIKVILKSSHLVPISLFHWNFPLENFRSFPTLHAGAQLCNSS